MQLSSICKDLFVEAIGCEIVHFFESFTDGGIYGNFSAMVMWAHEYMDIFLNIGGHHTWGHLKRAGGM